MTAPATPPTSIDPATAAAANGFLSTIIRLSPFICVVVWAAYAEEETAAGYLGRLEKNLGVCRAVSLSELPVSSQSRFSSGWHPALMQDANLHFRISSRDAAQRLMNRLTAAVALT